MDQTKTENVGESCEPKNVTELRAFLCLTEYYCQFIKDYATIAAPPTELTKKCKEFK